jgi:4-hydroxy-tetrahydrodipicolinate reductase
MTRPDRVVVTGATGRMGRAVLSAAAERGYDTLAVSESDPTAAAGTDLPGAFGEGDVLVDFTIPSASVGYVEAAATAEVPCVVGTTGYAEETGTEPLERAAEHVPVLRASNFARGVRALLGAVREAVAALPGYDVELTETHHNGKRDAPSGTANTVLEAVEETRDETGERVHGREGIQPRETGEVGVHVRRAGGIRGEHELLLAGNDEVLTLTHRAESRGVFAAGALDAAEWVHGRAAGAYGFDDVIEDARAEVDG